MGYATTQTVYWLEGQLDRGNCDATASCMKPPIDPNLIALTTQQELCSQGDSKDSPLFYGLWEPCKVSMSLLSW